MPPNSGSLDRRHQHAATAQSIGQVNIRHQSISHYPHPIHVSPADELPHFANVEWLFNTRTQDWDTGH
jgi:hypothetical protein